VQGGEARCKWLHFDIDLAGDAAALEQAEEAIRLQKEYNETLHLRERPQQQQQPMPLLAAPATAGHGLAAGPATCVSEAVPAAATVQSISSSTAKLAASPKARPTAVPRLDFASLSGSGTQQHSCHATVRSTGRSSRSAAGLLTESQTAALLSCLPGNMDTLVGSPRFAGGARSPTRAATQPPCSSRAQLQAASRYAGLCSSARAAGAAAADPKAASSEAKTATAAPAAAAGGAAAAGPAGAQRHHSSSGSSPGRGWPYSASHGHHVVQPQPSRDEWRAVAASCLTQRRAGQCRTPRPAGSSSARQGAIGCTAGSSRCGAAKAAGTLPLAAGSQQQPAVCAPLVPASAGRGGSQGGCGVQPTAGKACSSAAAGAAVHPTAAGVGAAPSPAPATPAFSMRQWEHAAASPASSARRNERAGATAALAAAAATAAAAAAADSSSPSRDRTASGTGALSSPHRHHTVGAAAAAGPPSTHQSMSTTKAVLAGHNAATARLGSAQEPAPAPSNADKLPLTPRLLGVTPGLVASSSKGVAAVVGSPKSARHAAATAAAVSTSSSTSGCNSARVQRHVQGPPAHSKASAYLAAPTGVQQRRQQQQQQQRMQASDRQDRQSSGSSSADSTPPSDTNSPSKVKSPRCRPLAASERAAAAAEHAGPGQERQAGSVLDASCRYLLSACAVPPAALLSPKYVGPVEAAVLKARTPRGRT